MAKPVCNYEEFQWQFEKLKDSRDLFAFFLFDDRPSQKAVERFADEQYAWLDSLAHSASIFFFFFLRRNRGKIKTFFIRDWRAPTPETKANMKGRIQNPSLEVGGLFGIKPNQLPGVVLFTLAPDRVGVSDGVYLPLNAKLFEGDLSHVEEVFTNLFSFIHECREISSNTGQLLENIKRKVSSLKRSERYRPLFLYIRGQLVSLTTFPGSLIEAIGKAFATEMARRIIIGQN